MGAGAEACVLAPAALVDPIVTIVARVAPVGFQNGIENETRTTARCL